MIKQHGRLLRSGKQYSLQKAAGERGVLYVRSVCANADPIAVLREHDQYHDIGVDAEIELLGLDRTTEGTIAYVQIKKERQRSCQTERRVSIHSRHFHFRVVVKS
jgi:hypothetical protein